MANSHARVDAFFGADWRQFVAAIADSPAQHWREQYATNRAAMTAAVNSQVVEDFENRMAHRMKTNSVGIQNYVTNVVFAMSSSHPAVQLPPVPESLHHSDDLSSMNPNSGIASTDELISSVEYNTRLLQELNAAAAAEEQELNAISARISAIEAILSILSTPPTSPEQMRHVVTEANGAFAELVALKELVRTTHGINL